MINQPKPSAKAGQAPVLLVCLAVAVLFVGLAFGVLALDRRLTTTVRRRP